MAGPALYLVSLVATRSVAVTGSLRPGIWLKLGATAVIGALFFARGAFPPVALAGGLALVLGAVVFAERMLFPAPAAG